ncbi:MAG: polysaccharide biosynthesis protein [Nitrosospira sp.]|nr:polysaccharide biosynthesis protein [Nitrosospira sp.]
MFKGQRILVTGAAGTVGSKLVEALLASDHYQPEEVIGLDNNESELFFVEHRHLQDNRAQFFLADVRDENGLKRAMEGMDIVFHVAGVKHVGLCERSPAEAVQTNINATEAVIRAAKYCGVERVLFTSTDKAVNPTNVMGTSKLMAERIMTAANGLSRAEKPMFTSTRFGNVLGSRGSVVPIFTRQIQSGGPVTLTDPDMTRFIMTVDEAVRLVIDSAIHARGGEVFITKMPVVRIEDLAAVMINELAPSYGHDPADIKVTTIGTKPGEKLYEELMSDEETRRAVELENYFAVTPAFRGLYKKISYDYPDIVSADVNRPYISANEAAMTRDELANYLRQNHILDQHLPTESHPTQRYWPGEEQ